MRPTSFSVVVLAIAGLSIAPLFASVTEPLSLRQLAAGATLIVRGSIVNVGTFSTPGRGIETVATIAVERVIKGEAEPFVSVHVPGGVVGQYRRVTIGAPVLRANQQAVFFLKRGADNGWRPVGRASGVVRVLTEPSTGRRMVYPVVLQGHTAAAGVVIRGDDRRRRLSVEEFEALVAMVLTDPPARGATP